MTDEVTRIDGTVQTFVIPFYHGSGSGTVMNYGSGAAKVRN